MWFKKSNKKSKLANFYNFFKWYWHFFNLSFNNDHSFNFCVNSKYFVIFKSFPINMGQKRSGIVEENHAWEVYKSIPLLWIFYQWIETLNFFI